MCRLQPVFLLHQLDAYLAPGEFLTPGVDPAVIYLVQLQKTQKAIEMDGLGFAMTFNGDVATAGTVSVDPIDPATLIGHLLRLLQHQVLGV